MSGTLAAVVVLATLACQPGGGKSGSKKSIVVTYSILGALVRELVGDEAKVTVSMPNGADPHAWEPSAKDIEAINKADLVVENGLGLEGGMADALERARERGVKFFTASDYVTVRHVGAGEGIPSDDPDQAVGAEDPHIWMAPLAMKSVVNALATELNQKFGLDLPERAADIGNRLDKLDREVSDIMAGIPPGDRKLVTGHESLGYFAQRYGFVLSGAIIPSLSTEAQLSAGELAELKKLIQDNRVRVVFTELGTPDAVARAIGAETGARVVQVDSALLPADGSYFTFMKNIAGTIAGALK